MLDRRMALTLLLCASACGEPEVQTHRQAVVDGTPDDTTGVVGVVRLTGASAGSCSGVAIAPQLVLTARNCIDDISGDFIDCTRTTFAGAQSASEISVTDEDRLSMNASDYTSAVELRVPDASEVCGNSIAMIVLSEPLESVPIVPALDAELMAGQAYTMHGYGPTDAMGGSGSSVRNSGPGTIECVGDDCPAESLIAANEFAGVDGSCQADGGGPAIDESGQAIGVVTRGSGFCENSVHTSIPAWSGWIVEQSRSAAEDNGFDVPAWAALDVGEDMGAQDMGTWPDAGGTMDLGNSPPDTGAEGVEGEDIGGGGCATAETSGHGLVGLLLLAVARIRRRR